MTRDGKTNYMVLSALMMGLIMVSTFTFKIPSPFTQGYVHLGDTMIFLGVLVLGKKGGALASALGSALADLLGGYAIYAIWTFIVKGLMAYVMGAFVEAALKSDKKHITFLGVPLVEIIGMVIGGIIMVVGYGIVEMALTGNIMIGILSMPPNVGQFVVGMVLAVALAASLFKTPAKKYFAYRLDEVAK